MDENLVNLPGAIQELELLELLFECQVMQVDFEVLQRLLDLGLIPLLDFRVILLEQLEKERVLQGFVLAEFLEHIQHFNGLQHSGQINLWWLQIEIVQDVADFFLGPLGGV